MAGNPEASKEIPVISEKRMSYMAGNNDGISNIAQSLGIREEYLKNLPNFGTIRFGDTFDLSVDQDGKGILTKNRNQVQAGERVIKAKFDLPKEAIYQNIEEDTSGFGIYYVRIPGSNKYQILASDGSIPLGKPIFIATSNLDTFRSELLKVSGKFITECNSRKEQYELSCSIKGVKGFPGSIEVNSNNLFDFISTKIDMMNLVRLIDGKEKPTPQTLGVLLATFATASASK